MYIMYIHRLVDTYLVYEKVYIWCIMRTCKYNWDLPIKPRTWLYKQFKVAS